MTYELTEDKRWELVHFAFKPVLGSSTPSTWKEHELCDLRGPIVNNCVATRGYSDEQIRRKSNNGMLLERIKGSSHYSYNHHTWRTRTLHAIPTLRDLAESGDPLSERIMDLLEIDYWDSDNKGSTICKLRDEVGSFSTISKIVEGLVTRTMDEEEYMGYLNGEKRIGELREGVGITHEQVQPIFLDSNSEEGFLLGESQCIRVAYAQNEAGP